MPLVLRGAAPVGSWSPSILPSPDHDTLERLAALYRNDPLLARPFAAARETQARMGEERMGAGRGKGAPLVALASAAGKFLSDPDGRARVAGWYGRMRSREAFRAAMDWSP